MNKKQRPSAQAVSGALKLHFARYRELRQLQPGIWGVNKNPGYEQVCSGGTGHAEVVQVTYDPARVTYDELLSVFWSIHNPTQMNRQGPDIGSNYRSVIFYHDAEQGQKARKSKEELQVSGRFGFGKIVTAIQPATEFWRREEYHQQYFEKHGGHAACGI